MLGYLFCRQKTHWTFLEGWPDTKKHKSHSSYLQDMGALSFPKGRMIHGYCSKCSSPVHYPGESFPIMLQNHSILFPSSVADIRYLWWLTFIEQHCNIPPSHGEGEPIPQVNTKGFSPWKSSFAVCESLIPARNGCCTPALTQAGLPVGIWQEHKASPATGWAEIWHKEPAQISHTLYLPLPLTLHVLKRSQIFSNPKYLYYVQLVAM